MRGDNSFLLFPRPRTAYQFSAMPTIVPDEHKI